MKQRDTKKSSFWVVWFGESESTGDETKPIKYVRNAERKARSLKQAGFYVEMLRIVCDYNTKTIDGFVVKRDVFVM